MENTKGKPVSNPEVVCRIIRVDETLKPYIPLVGVGITLLLDTWVFPEIPRNSVKNTRVLLNRVDREALDYLVQHSGKSATEVISAALVRAKNSKVRASNIPSAPSARAPADSDVRPLAPWSALVSVRPWQPIRVVTLAATTHR